MERILVHQIWLQGRAAVPPDILSAMQGWLDATASSDGYEYRFWDDASIRVLLPDVRIPAIRTIYERLPDGLRGIRADIARLVVLFEFGGLYVDADTRVLKPQALFDHFESALRGGAEAIVGTADMRGWTRGWIDATRRPSNFLLACPRRSRFVRAYLESICHDFRTLGIEDQLAGIGAWSFLQTLRLTKTWTGPRKLRALLRSRRHPGTIRLTPVGFVASAHQTCFPDAVVAHDYKANWYDKSKAWMAVRDWTLHTVLEAPLDGCIAVLVGILLLVLLRHLLARA